MMISYETDYEYLVQHRKIWSRKPVLRQIYNEQLYTPLLENLASGSHHLEIGSGPGFLGEIAPAIWCTDLLCSQWIDCVVDAHHLPVGNETLDNVIGLDVLHHFAQPMKVLREAARVLRPGGRFVLIEPWITPFSRFIYTFVHPENCDLKAQPWLDAAAIFEEDKKAFDGNPAIPYLLFKHIDILSREIPSLELKIMEPYSSITFLLSGGFQPYSLLPRIFYPPLRTLEKLINPLTARLIALRALMVWEKLEVGN